jgi:hypothetical protein
VGASNPEDNVRRSTKLFIALLALGVVMVPIAVFAFFGEAATVSSSSGAAAVTKVPIPLRPKPPSAGELRVLLVANKQHPTTCTTHGSTTVCLLARGAGRCEQDADGLGSCIHRGGNTSHPFLGWQTATVPSKLTVTGSDSR